MTYSFDDLVMKFHNYTDVKDKVGRGTKAGRAVMVTRGFYETDADTPDKYLAVLSVV